MTPLPYRVFQAVGHGLLRSLKKTLKKKKNPQHLPPTPRKEHRLLGLCQRVEDIFYVCRGRFSSPWSSGPAFRGTRGQTGGGSISLASHPCCPGRWSQSPVEDLGCAGLRERRLLLTSEAQGVEPGLPSPAAGKGSGSLRDQGSVLFFLTLGLFFRRGGITGASEPRCGAWPG